MSDIVNELRERTRLIEQKAPDLAMADTLHKRAAAEIESLRAELADAKMFVRVLTVILKRSSVRIARMGDGFTINSDACCGTALNLIDAIKNMSDKHPLMSGPSEQAKAILAAMQEGK